MTITSNGTMPRRRYEQLLRSRVDAIGISLDGVRRDNLPFSHERPPALSGRSGTGDEPAFCRSANRGGAE